MAKNTLSGYTNLKKIKMRINNSKTLLFICALIVGLTSCDPRDFSTCSLVVINNSGESLYITHFFDNKETSYYIQQNEKHNIYGVRFPNIEAYSGLSPYEKFLCYLKSERGGRVELFSVNEDKQPAECLRVWTVSDNIEGHHFFNEESLALTHSGLDETYEWTFTILPEDLED